MKKYIAILFLEIFIFIGSTVQAQWLQTNGPYGGQIYSLAVIGSNTFAGTKGSGVFLSTDHGGNWTAVNTGLTNKNIEALAVNGSNLFAGTWGGGVFRSTDNGVNWTAVNNGLTNNSINSLVVIGTDIFAGTLGRRCISFN